jgi:hypothetical protein
VSALPAKTDIELILALRPANDPRRTFTNRPKDAMMNTLARGLLIISLILNPVGLIADSNSPAQVMLFGVFHFANPGKDVVKTKQVNVMTPENQAFLDGLAKRIADFNPTIILLEFSPTNETEMQQDYRQFLEGTFAMTSNEVYQLGFRIARQSGAKTVYSFDERDVGWEAKELFEHMPKHDAEAQTRLDALFEEVTIAQRTAHATKSLAELLMETNDPEKDNINKYIYLITNHVGAGDNFVGADAAASWWHRNFRMYANIQKHAQPGERVLAIGGQGHTAILKDLLAIDRDRVAVDVRPYIADQ